MFRQAGAPLSAHRRWTPRYETIGIEKLTRIIGRKFRVVESRQASSPTGPWTRSTVVSPENLVIFFRDHTSPAAASRISGGKTSGLQIHPPRPDEGDDPALMKI